MPTAWAAIEMRLESRTSIAALKPPSSSPSLFSSGTATLSKYTCAVSEAHIPIFPCIGWASRPFMPRSSTSATTPLARLLRSVVAKTTSVSATLPLVMKFLLPLTT